MVESLPFQGEGAGSLPVRNTTRSISELVSYLTVYEKCSDRNRDRPPTNASIAQWSEQDAYIVKATGSSPVRSTKNKNKMKKIVIYKDVENVNGKKERHILRAIQPSYNWQGYTKNKNSMIDSEVRNLARALEPSFTGFYVV